MFIPFIDELKIKNTVCNISTKDFRIVHEMVSKRFIFPINKKNEEIFENMFLEYIDNNQR